MNRRTPLAIIILAFSVPIIVMVTALQLAVFDKDFFMAQTQENEVSKYTGLEVAEISKVTDEIFAYMKGERADFDIVAQIDGQEVHLFTPDEEKHMVDVRNLYNIAVLVRSVALLLTAGMILWLFFKNPPALLIGLGAGGLLGFLIMIFLTLAASYDFTEVFYLGHELLFSNDLWLLPGDSYLLNLVPEGYWISLFTRIGIYAAVTFVVLLLLVAIFMGLKKGQEPKIPQGSSRKLEPEDDGWQRRAR